MSSEPVSKSTEVISPKVTLSIRIRVLKVKSEVQPDSGPRGLTGKRISFMKMKLLLNGLRNLMEGNISLHINKYKYKSGGRLFL